MTDSELLYDYWRNASQESFREIVRRHLPLVFGTALRELAGNAHRAQDVTQTVFIDLARKAPSLCGRRTLAGWLYLATHHAAAALMRSEERRERREVEASRMHAMSNDSTPDWSRITPQLDRAILGLRETDRDAIVLRYHEGRSLADIGKALGLKEDAARHRVDRALERLRSRLRQLGITSTSSALALALGQETAAFGAALPSAPGPASIASQALAGAGAGAPSVPGTLIFLMSTSKITLAVAAAAIALVIAATVHTVRSQRQDAATLAQAAAEVSAATARLRALDLQQSRSVQRATPGRPSGSPVQPFTPAPPAIETAFRQNQYGLLNRSYARFYREYHFTAAQVAALDSAIDPDPRLAIGRDAQGRWMLHFLDEGVSDETIREQSVLGRDYAAFQEFRHDQANYALAARVAAEALQAGNPIEPFQVTALAKALIQTDRGWSNRFGDTPHNYDWDTVRTRMASGFGPEQLASLTSTQLQAQYRQQLSDEMHPGDKIAPPKP